MQQKKEQNVRAVERALRILSCFSTGQTGFSLIDIAKSIELPPSTALRLLTTLEQNDYLYRDPKSNRYYLGFRLTQISIWAYTQMDLCRVARPYLEELTQKFQESSGLYVIQGSRRVCVERVESDRSLRSVVNIGSDLALTRGASGHVLMAYMPEEAAIELLKEDPYYTVEQLLETRRRGYCISNSEREEGVISVAAPVFDVTQNIAAALFISGPSFRHNDDLIERMVKEVMVYADQISAKLGYQGDAENSGTKSMP